jgi:uncharacterized lipoprotein YehR (DUF1307 family)
MRKIVLVIGLLSAMLCGCEQKQDRSITLPSGIKVVSVSWQGSGGLWVLTREMRANEEAETYQLNLLGITQLASFHKRSYWKTDRIWITEQDMNGRAFGAPPAEKGE